MEDIKMTLLLYFTVPYISHEFILKNILIFPVLT